ncbi:MAG: xanthine dehydrogenase family protein molybdopterin-binding subunit [Actinomycetota bacterium]|nr:xanthine dehydrogenase family protein molybdopterin-binding subunit [Actinomycetota bacterium]
MNGRGTRLAVEDRPLLDGTARFTADLPADEPLWAVFVRSPMAHATIVSADVAEARRSPGVRAVLVADDLALPATRRYAYVPEAFARPPLAVGRVRMVGEPIAVVVADTLARAVDAAELVELDLDPLPAVVDPFAALADDAPLLFPEAGTNLVTRVAGASAIDVLGPASMVVRCRSRSPRLASAPMECSGIVAHWDGDRLDVWATSQGVHGFRTGLASGLGVEAESIRVRSPAVGGGFGGRGDAPYETVVVAAAARALGRTVRWQETRYENLVSMPQGRGQVVDVALGLGPGHRFTGIVVDVLVDTGAYPDMAASLGVARRELVGGPYRFEVAEHSVRAVVTNTTPIGAYRGAGQPELVLALERAVDMAARRCDIDPIELRHRNLLEPGDLPRRTAAGLRIDDRGDHVAALEHAIERADVEALREEQAARRARGDRVELGIGVASYLQLTARGDDVELASVGIDPSGAVAVRCGSAAHGQGHRSTLAPLVAARLGVGAGSVEWVDADTDVGPEANTTGGSRTIQVLGSHLVEVTERLVERARALAATQLEADAGDIVLMEARDGRPAGLGVAGVPASVVGWGELAALDHDLTESMVGPAEGPTFPYGTHVTVVEVDTETGGVRLRSHLAVDDCGVVLRRDLVEGQQHGGVVAGLAAALFEEAGYDEDGNPRAANFADYLLAGAPDVPSISTDVLTVRSPVNRLGARGIGENGALVAPASAINAIVDALAPYGVDHLDIPATPERVWQALEKARTRS